MKKAILSLAAAAALMIGTASAQSIGTAIVSTTLADILVMTYTSAPAFIFSSEASYQNGSTINETAAITVSSNRAFDISVASNAANLTKIASADVIPVSNFNVNASGDGGLAIGALVLGTTGQTLVDEAPAATAKLIDLSYNTAGGADFLNRSTGLYTVTLTYTASVD